MVNERRVRPVRVAALIIMVLSILMLIYSGISGDLELYMLFIIPVLRIRGIIGPISILLLIAGLIVLLISNFKGTIREYGGIPSKRGDNISKRKGPGSSSRSEWGGVIFLGPFPIVFGNARIVEKFPKWWVLSIFWIVIALVISLMSIAAIIILFRPW